MVLPVVGAASLSLNIVTHIDDVGNVNASEEMWAGSRGQSRKIQEFSVSFADTNEHAVSIIYQCHYETGGWSTWVKEGEKCGDEKKNKRLEAIKFKLTGKDASKYTLQVKCHIEGTGDTQGFVGASQVCGQTGLHKRLDAFWIEVRGNY